MRNLDEKKCPICHRYVEDYETICSCGYEFGSNRCSNPNCGTACKDFASFCSLCGYETYNYLNGYISSILTNVT